MRGDLRWHTPADGSPRFRTVPMNIADRDELINGGVTPSVSARLKWLEAEFEVLWRHGIIYHRSDGTAAHRGRQQGGRGVTLRGQQVLITGGTGSFGQAFTRRALDLGAARVVVFSRDELKQHDQRLALPDRRVRWFIGDVRNRDRLTQAMRGIHVVVHAAAMKHVDACEYNPDEAIATNVDGARNVVKAAIDSGVSRVLALSTDKAVDPINVYGKSKALAEDLFVDANVYSGADGTRFACTRYGNVISSRGSVLPLWLAAHERGDPLRITDPAMTRFVMTLQQGVDFVVRALGDMRGGEVFVPRLPAIDLLNLAYSVSWPRPPLTLKVGRRPGEKLHELLISENEAHRTRDEGDRFVVYRCLLKGGMDGAFSSATAERLDVAGFRALAGLDAAVAA